MIKAPEFLFHVSPAENRASIFSSGLLASKDQTGAGAVFLTDLETSFSAEEGVDQWSVDVRGLELAEDWTTDQEIGQFGRWWMYFGDIDPARLSLSMVRAIQSEAGEDGGINFWIRLPGRFVIRRFLRPSAFKVHAKTRLQSFLRHWRRNPCLAEWCLAPIRAQARRQSMASLDTTGSRLRSGSSIQPENSSDKVLPCVCQNRHPLRWGIVLSAIRKSVWAPKDRAGSTSARKIAKACCVLGSLDVEFIY